MDPEWAVIPAAGRGTRMAGITGGLPKELLPVGRAPLILHKIRSHLAAGIERICVVISPGKEAVREYLTSGAGPHPFGLAPLDKHALGPCELVFVYQESPRGVAHALSLARKVVRGSPFVAAMPDTLVEGHTSQLVAAFRETGADVVGLVKVDESTRERFSNLGVTDLPADLRPGEVRRVARFSPRAEGPIELGPGGAAVKIFGGGLFRPHYFDLADEVAGLQRRGELDDLPVMGLIMERFGLFGVLLEGRALDAGNPAGYEAARNLFGDREEI